MVARPHAGHSRTHRLDDSGGLVAQEMGQEAVFTPHSAGLQQLRVAHTTRGDPHEHLPLDGGGDGELLDRQRRVERPKDGGLHHSAMNQ